MSNEQWAMDNDQLPMINFQLPSRESGQWAMSDFQITLNSILPLQGGGGSNGTMSNDQYSIINYQCSMINEQ